MFGWYQNCFYLCNRFSEVKYSGCSAVRLAHLLWEQVFLYWNQGGRIILAQGGRIAWF